LAFRGVRFPDSFGLFLIEPMQGKLLLPLFRRLARRSEHLHVFFQLLLLLGYVYAPCRLDQMAPVSKSSSRPS